MRGKKTTKINFILVITLIFSLIVIPSTNINVDAVTAEDEINNTIDKDVENKDVRDITPVKPVLNSISFNDNNQYDAKEEGTMRISYGSLMGRIDIQWAEATFKAKNEPLETLEFYCNEEYQDMSKRYITLESWMGSNTPTAEFILDSLVVMLEDGTEEKYNRTQLAAIQPNNVVKVKGNDNIDYVRPVASNFVCNYKAEMRAGDNLVVSCNITDNKVASDKIFARIKVSEMIDGASKYTYKFYPLKYNQTSKKYSVTIPISQSTKTGYYSIIELTVSDGTYTKTYSYADTKYKYRVIGTTGVADKTAPIVTSLKVEQKPFNSSNKDRWVILDSYDIDGEIDAKSINATYKLKGSEEVLTVNTFGSSTIEGIWGKIDSTKVKSGTYEFQEVVVKDSVGNSTVKKRGDSGFIYEDILIINPVDFPVVNYIRKNDDYLRPGEELVIEVDITDKYNLVDRVYCNYLCDGIKVVKDEPEFMLDTTSGKYLYKIPITQTTPSGQYEFDISIESEGETEKYWGEIEVDIIGTDISSSNFKPTITDINLKNNSLSPGDIIFLDGKIDLKLYDNLDSGQIIFANIEDLNQNFSQNVSIKDGGFSTTLFRVPSNIKSGKYICKFRIYQDNYIDIEEGDSSALKKARLTITNPNEVDYTLTKDDIKDIKINKNSFNLGEEIKISVKAENKEKISSVYAYVVPNGYPYSSFGLPSIELTYNVSTKFYEGSLKVHGDMPSGEWRLSEITVYDLEDNDIDIFKGTDERYKFSIKGTNVDITPPIFKGMEINKKEFVNGETLNITLEAVDLESGVSSAMLYYEVMVGEGKKTESIKLNYNSITGKLEASITIDLQMARGQWKLESITIRNNEDSEYAEGITNIELEGYSKGEFTIK